MTQPSRRRLFIASAGSLLLLAGCAALPGTAPPKVSVVGFDALPNEGLELRFGVKLRVQNPNDFAIDYDGLAIDLEIGGRPLASGVSDARGSVPRYGEAVLTVPVSISALSVLHQALGLAQGHKLEGLPYRLQGRLGGGPFGGLRFASSGNFTSQRRAAPS